jgi:hypothetical protein
MVIHWIQEWSFLLPKAQRTHMHFGCIRLETVALDIFNQGGWRLSRRLQDAQVTCFIIFLLFDLYVLPT